NAYERRQVLHCDVSDGNSMFLVHNIFAESAIPSHPEKACEGWMICCRLYRSCRRGAPTTHHKSLWTLPFESNQLIIGEPIQFHHDLQSYFWLAYLITCNCAGPFNMCWDWDGEMSLFNLSKSIKPSDIKHMAENPGVIRKMHSCYYSS
ncbi:uncharacterized protein F5147DRAFT_572877, partial [Suillus discolor]